MSTRIKFAAFFGAAALCLAESVTFGQSAEVLPKQFGRWNGVPANAPVAQPAAELQREIGEGTPEVSGYANGSKQIVAILEKFKDPSGAYEAYTLKLRPEMQPSDIRKLSAVAPGRALMLIGNFVLEVDQSKNISTTDLRALASAVEAKADRTPLPPIRGYLPEEGLLQGTQRYSLGPAGFDAALTALNDNKFSPLTAEIGFATGAEAMVARYQAAPNKSQDLLIIDYPTPQIAEQRLRHIQAVIGANPSIAGANAERKGSLLSIVLTPVSAEAAAKLREEIGYQTEVTWNEPSQTLTDPPWLMVVKDIFVGTLVFCGVTIVLGIAFGGVRVLTKRLFPGKVFDRPEDMEVLQLGLSGKRIDPRDFY